MNFSCDFYKKYLQITFCIRNYSMCPGKLKMTIYIFVPASKIHVDNKNELFKH